MVTFVSIHSSHSPSRRWGTPTGRGHCRSAVWPQPVRRPAGDTATSRRQNPDTEIAPTAV